MRSMARRRPLGGLMGVSPFGLSSSPLADINYEFNRMLPLVDSMMNGASSSRSHVEITPVYDAQTVRSASTRGSNRASLCCFSKRDERHRKRRKASRNAPKTKNASEKSSPSLEALRVPRRRMYPPSFASRFPPPPDVAALSSAVFGHPDSVGSFPAKLAFPCDVLEKKREFLITADLPGLSKDVVNVTVDDERRLHITAERAERHEEKVGEDDEDVKMHVYERTYGKVERMFKLPENVEDEKIEADMKNGVLSVHIPKQPEPAKEQIPERAIKIK
jgi:HSP20 family protein